MKKAIITDIIATDVVYERQVVFYTKKPEGTPRKLMDVSKTNKFGWNPNLKKGIQIAVNEVINQFQKV